MVDFPELKGRMCDWDKVSAVDGACEALCELSLEHKIYVATGAADSSEKDIRKAFNRVNLDKYISGYFCESNLGVGKDSPDFFRLILAKLTLPASSVVMVGDSYKRDIEPALKLGIKAIWFNPNNLPLPCDVESIASLQDLSI